MEGVLAKARTFIFTNARLLERRIYEVHFENAPPDCVGQVVRAYQNPDGGLGHALEPDVRYPKSQPLFVAQGLSALEQAGYRDIEFAASLCGYLESVSGCNGLVPIITENAFRYPIAQHWYQFSPTPAINPTAEICGLLHYQGVENDWLSSATEACCELIFKDPPREAHTLYCVSRLAEYIPDRKIAMELLDVIDRCLPQASFYVAEAPVETYGLTPLHFAPEPDSFCRELFTQSQIDSHLDDLMKKQLPDGGWPITWEAPGPAAVLEWRGRWTLDAILRLSAYGLI